MLIIKAYSRGLIYVCVVAFLLSGCALLGKNTGSKPPQVVLEDGANRIAIAPFQKVISRDPAVTHVRCPLCGVVLETCESAINSEKIIEKIFVRKLQSYGRYVIIPPERVSGIYKRISVESFKDFPSDVLKKVGDELEADWVVAGYVFCYRDREGFAYSVKVPASVTFCVHLVRVKDGEIVWRKIFDKTQTSLMENLLDISSFVKGGGGWLTAEKLTELGVDEVLTTFPGLE